MLSYGKIEYRGGEYLFEVDDASYIGEGSGGTVRGRCFFDGKWMLWQISGRPMPDLKELTEQDKMKWGFMLREVKFFKRPYGIGE